MAETPDQHASEQEGSPKSGGGGRLIVIIIGFVVLLGVIGVVAMMVMGGSSKEGKESAAPIAKSAEPGYMYRFPEPFTGNLSAPDNDFVFSANVTLEIKPRGEELEKEALKEIGIGEGEKGDPRNKMPYVRRIILEEISSKTRLELTSSTGRERIANTIKNNLDNILDKAQIHEVFLEIFVN